MRDIAVVRGCLLVGALIVAPGLRAAQPPPDLTIAPPHRHRTVPVVRSPLLPGAPIPYSGSPLLTPQDLSIVDGRTRFLTSGPAQDRCPGDRIDFVPGVVNPFRPTAPGDGAFMCHGDAVAEGFSAP